MLVWLASGLGVWLTASGGSVTVGASGIVFGWLPTSSSAVGSPATSGRSWSGLVLLVRWGGIFWGVLPGASGVSWQAHLFGALGGILAAFLTGKVDRPPRSASAASA